jgi:hypothetical protein
MDAPQLSKKAFWDTNMESIDYSKHARFVVEKVVERGTHEDFINLLNFYGFEEVKQLVLRASWLSDVSINYCCTLFGVEPTDFKCYEKKQLNQQHWNF